MPICRLNLLLCVAVVVLASAAFSPATAADSAGPLSDASAVPNVILILTDDQGYGDLACHGNTQLQTPALDRLHAESVRLTNIHVDPTCSPTRAALMTGRYSSRTGVWHTIMGRSILHRDEVTLAQLFAAAGYRTGIFGKWHLGDNFPSRPQDKGFEEVLIHGGGGVGQTPDYWGNDYFDDTYLHNGVPKQFAGYCTDVWFDGALKFIEAHRHRPFFAYISTNAPHGPYLVADKYSRPYRQMGIESPRAEFYGMIANLDENLAHLRTKLDEWNLADNTLLVFMTDNGTAAGAAKAGFNAGMRGAKGSEYDGGHRVPCFFHWPAGKLIGGRDVTALTAHIDLLPTLAEICRLDLPRAADLDGKSLVPLLQGETDWPARTLCVHSQRIEHPEKWRQCAVMTERWRLVNGKELFDIRADPGQARDVAAHHPEVVAELRAAYEAWYAHISYRFEDYCRIMLGAAQENPATLTCHDWHTPEVPWSQAAVRRDPQVNGVWAVDILRAGAYEFTLRTRPAHVQQPLQAHTARLKIGDFDVARRIEPGSTGVTIRLDLPRGPAELQTWLDGPGRTSRGAYFVEVRFVQ